MSVVSCRPEHEVLYQDLCKLVSKHAEKLSSEEMLAVAANMMGKLVAMQDQRTMLPRKAMEIVAHNIEMGNKQIVDMLSVSQGRA